MWRNISDNIIFTLKKYFAKPGYIYEKKKVSQFSKKNVICDVFTVQISLKFLKFLFVELAAIIFMFYVFYY